MIVLYNPQVDDFLATPPHFRLLKRRALRKYGFFLDETLKAEGRIRALADATSSAFVPERVFSLLPAPLRRLVTRIECRMWEKQNDLVGKVDWLRGASDPQAAQAVLLAFSYKAATGPFALRLATFSAFRTVVFHLSHYFIATREKSAHLRQLPNAVLAGDSDVTGNDYFRRHFDWYRGRPFLVLPFAISPRFQQAKPWEQRTAACLATGSFHDLREEKPAWKYRDFMQATGSTTYHPVRKAIFDRAAELKPELDCYVSPFRGPQQNKRWWRKLLERFDVAQKQYFSINIAQLYNDYRYAVVGEELAGFPALGAFEALASGAVLIGEPYAYQGLGMQPQVHYIPHDGSIPGILEAVRSARRTDGGAVQELVCGMRPQPMHRRWTSTLAAMGG